MNELVVVKGNEVFTNSLVIAEGTENKHRSVQRIVDKHIKSLEKFGRVRFEITPLDTKGGIQNTKIYFFNEEQATFLITLLRNNDIVIDFKIRLVKDFYRMKKFILERQSIEWDEARHQSKLTRKEETDTIKEYVGYARNQGSRYPENYYCSFSKLANRAAEITSNGRDNASTEQLNILAVTEKIISNAINENMQAGLPYKKIYIDCKLKVEILKNLVHASEKHLSN